jgi:hypothetical protein
VLRLRVRAQHTLVKGNGTSTMLKHSQTKHGQWAAAQLKAAGVSLVKPAGLREMAMRTALTEATAVLCAVDNRPFYLVERPGFQYFCRRLKLDPVPCATTIARRIPALAGAVKLSIRQILADDKMAVGGEFVHFSVHTARGRSPRTAPRLSGAALRGADGRMEFEGEGRVLLRERALHHQAMGPAQVHHPRRAHAK